MLSSRLVRSRRSAYSCCAEASEVQAITDAIYGDSACADKNEAWSAYFWWASDVMTRTPIDDDDTDCLCITDEFALKVISLADPECVQCNNCGDRPRSCDITARYTVYSGEDTSFEPDAQAGVYYLIITNQNSLSGGWADHIGEVVIDSTFIVPNPGDIIYDAYHEIYYVRNDQDETTELFPRLDADLTGTTLTVTSRAPNTNAYLGRFCVVETSLDATNWTAIYSGTEAVFATPQDYTVDAETLYIRVTYYNPFSSQFRCEYGPFMGLLTPDTSPPIPSRSLSFDSGTFLGPVAAGTIPFNFPTAASWTIAFWYQSDTPGGIPYNAPLLLQATDGGNCGTGSTTGSDFGISWADAGGGQGSYLNATLNDTLSDGSWHHIAFVKTTSDNFTAPKCYLDGIAVVLTPSAIVAPVISGAECAPYLGDISSFVTAPFHMASVYMCSIALSQAQIQSIIIPNLMATNDGTFGRLAWYQPSLADVMGSSPYISANTVGSPALTNTGAVVFDTVDLPPIP